jgi:hypothetical protein
MRESEARSQALNQEAHRHLDCVAILVQRGPPDWAQAPAPGALPKMAER